MSSKKTNKIAKIPAAKPAKASEKLQTFLQDLQYAYAKALKNIFDVWVHDDDGGCDYDAVGYRQTVICNSIMIMYQPMKSDGWVEDGAILLMPTKESGFELTAAIVAKTKPLFEEVENKVIDSYNGHVRKFGHWIQPTVKAGLTGPGDMDFNTITSIFDPIRFDKGVLKFKWNIKALWNGPLYRWHPVELIQWYHTLPAHIEYCKAKYEKAFSTLNPTIEEMKTNKIVSEVELTTLPEENTEKKKQLEDSIQANNDYIHMKESQLKGLMEAFTNPAPETSYTDDDDSFLTEWYEENKAGPGKKGYLNDPSDCMIAKEVSYEDAFPLRFPKPVAGKKRGAGEALTGADKKSK